MPLAFFATLAAQVGAAVFNNKKGKEHSELLARKQQAYEEKVIRLGIEHAQAEYEELCILQRELESELQADRLKLIQSNHQKSLVLDAYEESLQSWPLLVPPYVIKNDALFSIEEFGSGKIPLNCIMTTSSDNNFNNAIYYKLEESIANFCSKYWNISANKSIRFLQETWCDTFSDVGSKHRNLYAHLSDIPTLVISPLIKGGKLVFRFYWWGLSQDPEDAHLSDLANEFDPELSISISFGMQYTDEITNAILTKCTPKLEAFISYFADLYYWHFYKESPLLPSLIKGTYIKLLPEDIVDIKAQYTKQLEVYCDSNDCLYKSPAIAEGLFNSVSQIADPKRIEECVEKYINNKKRKYELNCRDLSLLKSVKDIILSSERIKVEQAISYIEEHEKTGFIACAGRNDIIQTILYKAFQLNAEYVTFQVVNSNISYLQFLDAHRQLLISSTGYRTYLCVHPCYEISSDCVFTVSSKTFKVSNEINNCAEVHKIDEDELRSIYKAQKTFVETLKTSYDRLAHELWSGNLELVDLTYENILSIIKQLCKINLDADSAYIIIGYSSLSDNYYISIDIIKNNEFVGDSFACRLNSLSEDVRNKLDYKSILKIKLK
jgi:hypothetical protein